MKARRGSTANEQNAGQRLNCLWRFPTFIVSNLKVSFGRIPALPPSRCNGKDAQIAVIRQQGGERVKSRRGGHLSNG
jgi:hypothetical protein